MSHETSETGDYATPASSSITRIVAVRPLLAGVVASGCPCGRACSLVVGKYRRKVVPRPPDSQTVQNEAAIAAYRDSLQASLQCSSEPKILLQGSGNTILEDTARRLAAMPELEKNAGGVLDSLLGSIAPAARRDLWEAILKLGVRRKELTRQNVVVFGSNTTAIRTRAVFEHVSVNVLRRN